MRDGRFARVVKLRMSMKSLTTCNLRVTAFGRVMRQAGHKPRPNKERMVNKMIVVRFSKNIQADVKRNWSAWMNTRTENLAEFIQVCLDHCWSEKASELQDEENYQEALEIFEELLDIRIDGNQYAIVHHDGLSCFGLEAEEEKEAITEAEEFVENFDMSFFVNGDKTLGEIKIIKEISENWYLLEVEDFTTE